MAIMHLDRDEVEHDELPSVCLRCGEPAVTRKSKTFSWHPSWVIILIFAGLLVYVIVAIVLTKRMTVRVPLCEQHRNHWLSRNLFGFLGLAALLLFGVTAIVMLEDAKPAGGGASGFGGILCLGTVVLALAWLIILAVLHSNAIRPTEITDHSIALTNVSPEFIKAVDEQQARPDDYPEPAPYRIKPIRPTRQSRDLYDPDRPREQPPDDFGAEDSRDTF